MRRRDWQVLEVEQEEGQHRHLEEEGEERKKIHLLRLVRLLLGRS
jgi:hypothetical protein